MGRQSAKVVNTAASSSGGEVLPSTIDSPEIDKRIEAAAALRFPDAEKRETFFEHGHWWCRVDYGKAGNEARTGDDQDVTYDVVDAEGGESIDGFDFEEV